MEHVTRAIARAMIPPSNTLPETTGKKPTRKEPNAGSIAQPDDVSDPLMSRSPLNSFAAVQATLADLNNLM